MLPLAAALRPNNLADFIGQKHILDKQTALYHSICHGKLHSMILWGPPGTGKTTLAYIAANASNAQFLSLSAVMGGVKDIRQAVEKAKTYYSLKKQPTVFFVDEVHHFNKSQQDAFLPFVEDGTITFIGATTENPSFALNNALLSRVHVYVLNALTQKDLQQLLSHTINYCQKKWGLTINIPNELKQILYTFADGDARKLLNIVELLLPKMRNTQTLMVNDTLLQNALSQSLRRFDKSGDAFYNQLSALHKAVRGSHPDAALYWFSRMIDGGCDPLYLARRIIRIASEDIGNADPRGLSIAINAWDAYQRLGTPEGELALAQAIVYLAIAPKSNAIYTALQNAKHDAATTGSLPVPPHLCNAPTTLMKNLGYGKKYRYDHNQQHAFSQGQTYFPETMKPQIYYHPTLRGLEIKISEKLSQLRQPIKEPTQ